MAWSISLQQAVVRLTPTILVAIFLVVGCDSKIKVCGVDLGGPSGSINASAPKN